MASSPSDLLEGTTDPEENLTNGDEWLRLVEDKAELLLLARRIKTDLPFSASVHNLLRMTATTTCQPFVFYVPRQREAASRIVLCKEKTREFWGVSCPPEELDTLRQVLLRSQLLDQRARHIYFAQLSEATLKVINQVLVERTGCQPTPYVETTLYHMVVHKALKAPPPLPGSDVSVQVCLLGEVGTRKMYNAWKHKGIVPFQLLERLWQELPALGVYFHPHRGTPAVPSEKATPCQQPPEKEPGIPSARFPGEVKSGTGVLEVPGVPSTPESQPAVVLYPPEPSGWIPISWVAFSRLGALGGLMTEGEHRRQGYATKVFLECARYMAVLGYEAIAHVEDGNEAAHAFLLKCGFIPCGRALWTQIVRPHTK